MDTKKLEIQAENLVSSQLLKYGFKVNKPHFDKEGTDLLIVKDISQKTTPIVNVQCKGRSIENNNSNIKIPVEYVKENFLVFLYIVEEKTKNDFIYVFFENDIHEWRNDGKNFCLTIPKDFQNREEFRKKTV